MAEKNNAKNKQVVKTATAKEAAKKNNNTNKVGGAKASAKKTSPKKVEMKKETKKVETKVEEVEVKKQSQKNVKENVKEVSKEELMASLETEKAIKAENRKEWKEILLKIWDIVFWICFVVIALTWLTDYFRIRDNKEPQFCISNKTHQFEDGTVKQCTGIGYKVYTYERESLDNGVEFVPFFVKMQEPKTEK